MRRKTSRDGGETGDSAGTSSPRDSGQSGGNAGAAGTAGAPVAGGAAGSEGGSPMESGEDAALPPDEETVPAKTGDGCSCRLAPARKTRGLSLLAIAVSCLLLRSRGGNRHARRAGVAPFLRNL